MNTHPGRFKHDFLIAAMAALPLLAAGCSFSHSSGSISDSVESSSDSSSGSSESGQEKKYQNEVADYTMAYVKSSHAEADYTSYLKGLSEIASKRGIVNWEQEPKTYIAIGRGLKKAGLEGVAYETYKKNLANSDEEKMKAVQTGYDSEK
jgi:hypothetical protein